MDILIYLAVGAVAGVLAGLLGVGGGIVIVPILDMIFGYLHYPPETSHHLALGTSLASIMFTSISSMRSHNKRGAVIWAIVKGITPGIIVGTYLGSWVAALLSTSFLKGFFVAFLFWVSIQMLLDIKPKAQRTLPGFGGMFAMGMVIGIVSALVGIGGGSLSVPFMVFCNVPMHQAVGTSAAIGFPIAVAGAIGYVVNGWNAANLPPHTLGFVSIPALFGIASMSMLTAPLGAKLAHSLPVGKLKKFFALFLLFMGIRMLISLL